MTKLEGFDCDLLDYCVSVTHDCVYYQDQLKPLVFTVDGDGTYFELGPKQYMQDDFRGAQCAILISQLSENTVSEYVFGLTFLRSFYLTLDFSSDDQQYIVLI